jgi:hypothetical protein
MIGERAHDHGSSRHLVWIVAGLTHGLLRIVARCLERDYALLTYCLSMIFSENR